MKAIISDLIATLIILSIISCNDRSFQKGGNNQNTENQTISDPFIKMPEVISKPDIEYPVKMINYGKEVIVYVSARIDLDGNVNDVKVVKSKNSAFNKYAINYAYEYKFKPGEKDGKKTEMYISWSIDFKLNK